MVAEDSWISYLRAQREKFLVNRRQSLGTDYFYDTTAWDIVLEKEWFQHQEILTPIMDSSDRPTNIEDLLEPISTPEIIEKLQVGEDILDLYYFEDFQMLANQGIFRESHFLIDKGRKWEKKAIELVTQYGYQHIGYYQEYLEFMAVRL
jgi:hypothetical protein